MAQRLIAGIADTSDPKELHERFSGITNIVPTDKLSIITNSRRTSEHEDTPLHFIHTAGSEHTTSDEPHNVISGNTGILTTTDGTQMPNISADSRYMGFFDEPHIVDFLADFDIPDDERQNYNEAIAEGRSVVVYRHDTGDTTGVADSLRGAGLKNVREYGGVSDNQE